MELFSNVLVNIDNGKFTLSELVSILVLIEERIDINTISEMARLEGKTPRGIKTSKNYRKVKIGKQLFVIKNLRDDNF